METALLTIGVMALCFVGLGIGLILSKKICIKGSCGGANKDPNSACPDCSRRK
ncbi:MAG: hypothetical protein ABIJ96_12215 [Elusimicrobiota bacterium]